MLTKLHTFSLFGIQAIPVEVEVDISPGAVPKTILVGLAEAAAKESIHRIERALVNCGFQRSYDKVVINLSPAELPKEAASFDLPVALGLLSSSGQLPPDRVSRIAATGELALDGGLRRCKGALAMAIAAKAAGSGRLGRPHGQRAGSAVVEGLDVYAVDSLAEAVGFFAGTLELEPVVFRWSDALAEAGGYDTDYADVKGQELAKRAVTVAAAGNHHILMLGPPGTGKTLIAQRLATILPDLTPEESLQTTQIYSPWGDWGGRTPCCSSVRSARRTTRFRRRDLWAAEACRHQANSASPTTACCFSTNSPNSTAALWKCCVNRLRRGRLPSRGRWVASPFRPASCSSAPSIRARVDIGAIPDAIAIAAPFRSNAISAS